MSGRPFTRHYLTKSQSSLPPCPEFGTGEEEGEGEGEGEEMRKDVSGIIYIYGNYILPSFQKKKSPNYTPKSISC